MDFGLGLGYEGSFGGLFPLGSMFSLGGYVDYITGSNYVVDNNVEFSAFDIIARFRYYPLKSSLEKLFIGVNAGVGWLNGSISGSYGGYSYSYNSEPYTIFNFGLDAGLRFWRFRSPPCRSAPCNQIRCQRRHLCRDYNFWT
ncbi:MAG: hypothetical protein LBU85_12005 [Treponema sp.]|jgi:hypothetical protein|nr:hypothetical protein [Treponema sp.]